MRFGSSRGVCMCPGPRRLLGQAEGRCSQQENVCLTLRVSARQESCCVQRLHPQMAAAEALLVLRVRLWLAKGCDGGLEASFQLKSRRMLRKEKTPCAAAV